MRRSLTGRRHYQRSGLGATSAIVVRRVKPDAGYRIAPPFWP